MAEGPEGCTSRTVLEEDIHKAVSEAFNQVLDGGDSVVSILRENIEAVVSTSNEQVIAKINTEIEEKQLELIRYANSGRDYESLAEEIQELSRRKQAVYTDEAGIKGEKERIAEMMQFIEARAKTTIEFDEELARLLIEKVSIVENSIVVRFKSGIEVEI